MTYYFPGNQPVVLQERPMSETSSTSVNLRAIVDTLRKYAAVWSGAAAVCGAVALVFAITRPMVWQATQAILIRDEARGGPSHPGRFETADALEAAQDTIIQLARNQNVVAQALAEAGRPDGSDSGAEWPTEDAVRAAQEGISVAPPKGIEPGKSEVLYVSARGSSRQESVRLATAVCNQLRRRLQEVQQARAQSMIDELEQAETIARAVLDDATRRLEAVERSVGPDLGELRTLNESGAGDSNLRSALNQIQEEWRAARSRHEADQERLRLLSEAREDEERLLAAPQRLFEDFSALKRLKDGLVDAQIRTANLSGKMSPEHPEVQAAQAAEREIARQVDAELENVLTGLAADLEVSAAQMESLAAQAADVESRLTRLADLRARYANLVAEAQHANDLVVQAGKDLAEARARHLAALESSLITPLDEPDAGPAPLGPGTATIVLGGLGAGLVLGLGAVFLIAPGGRKWGRRWSDLVNRGRRASDREAAQSVQPSTPRPAGVERRVAGRRAADRSIADRKEAESPPPEPATATPEAGTDR
jgi:uncharacterized protein involved in exopolysaccharide biosynthesis